MRLLLFNLATDADDTVLGFTTRWISELAKRMESIDVITMRAGRLEVPDNVRVHSVGKEKGYGEPRRAVEFYRHLYRVLRESRPDACFSHMIPLFTVMAAPVLKIRRIPIVTWYAHPKLTTMLRLAHHFSDRMVTSLPTAYPYRRDKLVVIGQGIDTDLFSPNGSEPDYPPMILCVGRISPVKNHRTLLEAVALLRDDSAQPFQVVIIGDPVVPGDVAYLAEMKRLVQDLALDDIVRFIPGMPAKDLPKWYRRCLVHVNMTPSGFGDKVVLEAMSCGRVSLAANSGFLETTGEYSGLSVYDDHRDLCSKLSIILNTPAEARRQIESFGRDQVMRMHSVNTIPSRLLKTFDDS